MIFKITFRDKLKPLCFTQFCEEKTKYRNKDFNIFLHDNLVRRNITKVPTNRFSHFLSGAIPGMPNEYYSSGINITCLVNGVEYCYLHELEKQKLVNKKYFDFSKPGGSAGSVSTWNTTGVVWNITGVDVNVAQQTWRSRINLIGAEWHQANQQQANIAARLNHADLEQQNFVAEAILDRADLEQGNLAMLEVDAQVIEQHDWVLEHEPNND